MRILVLLVAIITLGLAGCSTSRPDVHAPVKNAVGDLDIHSATFGTGTHVVDVTDRVVALLRSGPAGFSARGDVLGKDPLPYSTKCLVIDYYYQGKPYRFFVANQQHVSSALLLKRAKQ